MNYSRGNKEKRGTHGHSPIKHMIHMILCCGLPIVIIFALPFVARVSPVAAGFLGIITPFICPIMMGGMLLMMFGKKKSSCCDTKTEISNEDLSAK